jgi:sphingomyelin phosphodiesterase acid-like 3
LKKIHLFLIILSLDQTIFAQTNNKFIVLSDIHFNPFVACDPNTVTCPVVNALNKADAKDWPNILEKYDTTVPQFYKETDYSLLKSTLHALSTVAAKKQPQFVLISGDFLSHNFKKTYQHYTNDVSSKDYQAFVTKTIQFLSTEFATSLPHTDVYSALGNNDSDQDDYYTIPHGVFLKTTAQSWAALIKNKDNRANFLQDFPTAGYYTVIAGPGKKLRIIVLNSTLFSKHAIGAPNQIKKAALQQLAWLNTQLNLATAQQQQVLLVFHIPPGINAFASVRKHPIRGVAMWKISFNEKFLLTLAEYSPHITGVLAGHLHSDSFQLFKTNNNSLLPINLTPAISPEFGNNPGFKVYSYNPKSLQLTDFTTYFYPLQEWPAASWQPEYDFNQVYQPQCKDCTLLQGMQQLTATNSLAQAYIKYYSVSQAAQPIAKGYWMPYYWCAITALTKKSYDPCVSSSRKL